MKVSEFTGGLNTKTDPSLLPGNSAVTLVNCDIASGVLKAMNNVSDDAKYSGVLNNFIQHKGNILSSAEAAVGYTEYASDLYYTEGGVLKQLRSATEYDVGLAKPSSAVVLGSSSAPETPTLSANSGDLIKAEFSGISGGLPSIVVYDYLIVSKDPDGLIYSEELFSPLLLTTGFRIEGSGAKDGFTLLVYREYLGIYRLLGEVSDGVTVDDIVLDISANTATTVDGGLSDGLGGNTYDYEYYKLSTYLAATLYSVSEDTSVIYTDLTSSPVVFPIYADIGNVAKFVVADDTDLILVRVRTDPLTGVVTRYLVPYFSSVGAYMDYEENCSSYTSIEIPALLSGTYTYVTTFYNSVNGYESQPSAISDEEVVVRGSINVTNILNNSAATHVRIYRVGGALTQFTLVTQEVIGITSYADILGDLEVSGALLISEDYNVPLNNLTLLTEANGVLLAAIGPNLYFSKQGLVFAWPLENFIKFKTDITCIQEGANGVIVATETETFVITGNSPESYSKYPVSGEHGCLFNTSFQKLRNGVIFKSATALVFTTGGEVTVLTEKFFNPLDITVIGSAVHNNTYYALGTADIFVYNLTDGNYYTIGLTASNIGVVDNKVHALIGTELHTLGEGSTLATLEYKSPVFTDSGHSENKSYKSIYMAANGTFTVNIYLDGVIEATKSIATTKVEAIEIKVSQKKQRAVNMQVEIIGTGTIYEYEWKSLGRQNGR